MKSWFEIQNRVPDNKAESNSAVEIYLYNDIGFWGVTALDFVREVKNNLEGDNAKELEIHINSNGGEVFDGLAIYNFLRDLANPVTIYVDGIAASIASVIAMSANNLIMPKNSILMIHNVWCGCIGEAEELRKMADLTEKLSNIIADIYEERTGIDNKKLKQMMKDSTYLNGSEAVEQKFADMNTPPVKVVASCQLNKFFNGADTYKNLFSDKTPTKPINQKTENQPKNKTQNGDDEMHIDEHDSLVNAIKEEHTAILQAKDAKVVELQNKLTAQTETHTAELKAETEKVNNLQAKVTEYDETFENAKDNGTGDDVQALTGDDALKAKARKVLGY